MTDLLGLLQEFYRDKLTMLPAASGGGAAGRAVRREQHLPIHHQPRRRAAHLGGEGDRGAGRHRARCRPRRSAKPQGKAAAAALAVIEEDGRDAQAFVDRWRPRIELMANARHAKMLRVDPRRSPGAEAVLRAGAGGPHRPARAARGAPRAGARRSAPEPVDRVARRARQQPRATGAPTSITPSRRCAACSASLTVSTYHDTVPVGVAGPQPLYLNAAAVGDTAAAGAGAAGRAARASRASAGGCVRIRTRRGRSIWI